MSGLLDCGPTCEVQQYLGAKGVCNRTTGICMCPPGYGGFDEWDVVPANDCHVNLGVQRGMHLILICMAVVTIVIGLAGISFLCYHWSVVDFRAGEGSPGRYNLEPQTSQDSSSSLRSVDLEEQKERRFQRRKRNQVRKNAWRLMPAWVTTKNQALAYKRRRDTISMLFMMVCYAISGLVYIYPYLHQQRRADNWYQDLGLAIAAPSVLISLWAVIYIWFRSFPALKARYGMFLDMSNILIKYPSFILYFTVFHTVMVFVASLILLFIIPNAYVGDDIVHLRKLCDTMFLWVIAVFMFDFFWFFVSIIMLLESVTNRLTRLANAAGTTCDKNPWQCLRTNDPNCGNPLHKDRDFLNLGATGLIMKRASYVIAPSTITIGLITVLSDIGRRNVYLFFNLSAMVGFVIALIVFYIFTFKLSGKKIQGGGPSPNQNSPDHRNQLNRWADISTAGDESVTGVTSFAQTMSAVGSFSNLETVKENA